jgi:hypothetical protein
MKFYAILATAIFALGWVVPIEAGDFWSRLLPAKCRPIDCVGGYCCDDYCPKSPPCIVGPCGFCCDDYCPKPPPCIVGPCGFCCDDYCPKCPPTLCCPPAPGLQCGPCDKKAGQPPTTVPDKTLIFAQPTPIRDEASTSLLRPVVPASASVVLPVSSGPARADSLYEPGGMIQEDPIDY